VSNLKIEKINDTLTVISSSEKTFGDYRLISPSKIFARINFEKIEMSIEVIRFILSAKECEDIYMNPFGNKLVIQESTITLESSIDSIRESNFDNFNIKDSQIEVSIEAERILKDLLNKREMINKLNKF
jgi:hypothetical protein